MRFNSNISKLQNEETLTSLHRAQRIQISSLPFGPIASNYANILKIVCDSALELAKIYKKIMLMHINFLVRYSIKIIKIK